ncbi:MAG: hypothetical protein HGA71_12910 [Azonexaceae bacterium]|nr:hypothetical protein [Azonexaceae bacterium]
MRELMSEFKELRLHCMAGAGKELSTNGGTGRHAGDDRLEQNPPAWLS